MRGSAIRTPDQRLRVFVSSTLGELAEERRAVRAAVERLRLAPVMFELGARPHPPRALYRSYLEQSDVFVGLYWQSYGWVAPDMDISGLQDELDLSTGLPRLIYLKRPAPEMDPRLRAMLDRLREEDSTSYKPFADADELHRLVLDDLSLMLTESFTGASYAAPPPPQVPRPSTTFVGRDTAMQELVDLLSAGGHRLVTLVGPGGAGKTRLALETAARVADEYADGVVLVDLSDERAPDKVLDAIVRALAPVAAADASPLEALRRALLEARMLLVIDNFEQLTPGAPALAQLVQACTGLTVLVTSRESLRVRGETVVAVPPLELPAENAAATAATQAPAVRLFLDRAGAAAPDLSLDARGRADVIAICRRLDGLPLAIELAAARLRLFSLAELRERLEQGLEELRGGPRDLPHRQQTLRRTIEWSVGLLSEAERLVLAALSFFRGARLPDIESVLRRVPELSSLDIVECTAALLDKSLLRVLPAGSGGPRFAMLETIRSHAQEQATPTLAGAVERAHAEHYTDLARHWWQGSGPGGREEVLAALTEEHANLRVAWSFWVRAGELPALNELLELLWGYYDATGAYREAVALGEDLLSVLSLQPASAERIRDEIAMETSLARSLIAVRGYTAEVERRITEAVERAGDSGEAHHRFPVLRALGTLHLLRADLPRSRAISEELLEIASDLEDPNLLADAHQLAGITQMSVDLHRGIAHLDTSLELFDDAPSPRVQFRIGPSPGVVSGVVSGLMLWMTGFPERAQRRVDHALERARDLGHPYTEAYALFHASLLALWSGDLRRVAAQAEALRAVAERHEYPIWAALATVLSGTARIGTGDPEAGAAEVDRGFALYGGLETPPIFWSGLLMIRAAGSLRAGKVEEAARQLDEAAAAEWEQDPQQADLESLRGELLLARSDPDGAVAAFARAAFLAGERGMRMTQLVALTRLAVLRADPASYAALAAALDGFTEGFATPQLVEASRVLGREPQQVAKITGPS